MKKLILSIVALSSIAYGVAAVSQTTATVVVRGNPVELVKQGQVYVVPPNVTVTTPAYYSYSENGSRYICTAESPSELNNVTFQTINISTGGRTSSVYCYPSTYFVIQ